MCGSGRRINAVIMSNVCSLTSAAGGVRPRMHWEVIIDAIILQYNSTRSSPASRDQSEERWSSFSKLTCERALEGLKRITGISGANRSEMFDLTVQYLEPSEVALCCLGPDTTGQGTASGYEFRGKRDRVAGNDACTR